MQQRLKKVISQSSGVAVTVVQNMQSVGPLSEWVDAYVARIDDGQGRPVFAREAQTGQALLIVGDVCVALEFGHDLLASRALALPPDAIVMYDDGQGDGASDMTADEAIALAASGGFPTYRG